MSEQNPLEEPASEREDRPDELYGTREYPPGLQTPLRPSESDVPIRPRCSSCLGRVELVDVPWGASYWRHLDLVDLEFPHAAHVDQLGADAEAAGAGAGSVGPAVADGDVHKVQDYVSDLGAEEDSCAEQDYPKADH